MELRRITDYHIVIQEKALLANIDECLKLLDTKGKYFYIKHHKGEIEPHYHIYYSSNSPIDEFEVEDLFIENVATRVDVAKSSIGKYPMLAYMLKNGIYSLRDIVSTMSLK